MNNQLGLQRSGAEGKRAISFPNRMKGYPTLSDARLGRLGAIRAIGSQVARPRGSVLFAEGQEVLGAFVLWDGRVKLTIASDDGKSLILGLVGRGTVLGLPAAILGLPHAATAQVVKAAKVAFIGRDDLLRYLQTHDDAAYEAAEVVSALYYSALAEIKSVHLCQSAEQKLARFLLGLSPTSRTAKGQLQLTLESNQEEIGQMIGVARETVARTISRFKKRHILDLTNRILTIHDRRALERIADSRGAQENTGSEG